MAFSRDISTLRGGGFDSPLKLKNLGRYVLSVAPPGEGRLKSVSGPTPSASYFEWVFSKKRPNFTDGGLRPPYEKDGLYQFDFPLKLKSLGRYVLGVTPSEEGRPKSVKGPTPSASFFE